MSDRWDDYDQVKKLIEDMESCAMSLRLWSAEPTFFQLKRLLVMGGMLSGAVVEQLWQKEGSNEPDH